jgi:predicted alpha/beta hydrolase family esterase
MGITKTAIILHGMPSQEEYADPARPAPSNCHWLPWIQRQLLLKGILAQTPEMPEPYRPDYAKWRGMFERFSADQDTILIGHSCGAGFIVRWLSENKVKVGRVVLVAPWLDPERKLKGFFDFDIDPALPSRTDGVVVLNSTDDFEGIQISVDKLREPLKDARFIDLQGLGHFCLDDMKTQEFPQLLAALGV